MTARLNPYLNFAGNTREAMEFYHSVFGGDLKLNTFAEFGTEGPQADKIMHAMLEADNGFTLMASDTMPDMPYNPGNNITISLSGDSADELHGYWEKLAGAGTVMLALEKQMWGDEFGMCTDQFGIQWMVNIAQQTA